MGQEVSKIPPRSVGALSMASMGNSVLVLFYCCILLLTSVHATNGSLKVRELRGFVLHLSYNLIDFGILTLFYVPSLIYL